MTEESHSIVQHVINVKGAVGLEIRIQSVWSFRSHLSSPVSIVRGDHGCMFCFRWTAPLTCLPLSSYLLKLNLMCTHSLRPHPAIFGSIHTPLITCCMLRCKTFRCVTCTNAPSVFVLLLLWNKWISPLTWSRSLTDGLVAFCFILSSCVCQHPAAGWWPGVLKAMRRIFTQAELKTSRRQLFRTWQNNRTSSVLW